MNWNLAEFSAAYGTASQLPKCDSPEIAFAGRSNVGKSTLINKLFQRRNLARVSSVPGKTATVNFYRCENITFADLPGYGYAKRSKSELRRWQELINGYLQDDRDLRAVLLPGGGDGRAGDPVPLLHRLLCEHRAEYAGDVALLQHGHGPQLRVVRPGAHCEEPGDVSH